MNREGDLARADLRLTAFVDAILARAAGLAGAHLVCRPGCAECCIGPFPITQLDALRLRRGLKDLAARDPARAERLKTRARDVVDRLSADFPGDLERGLLSSCEAANESFFARHEDLPCPALDPASGLCELYAFRPVSCRTFGPPVRIEGVPLPPCRLCFTQASGIRCSVKAPRSLSLALALAIGAAASAQAGDSSRVHVSMDSGEADAVLAILQKEKTGAPVRASDSDQLFETDGFRRLEAREAAMKVPFTREEFRAFVRSSALVARADDLASALVSWKKVDVGAAAERPLAYLPEDAEIRATIFVVLKPKSNSFVFGQPDPAIFLAVDLSVTPPKLSNTLPHGREGARWSAALLTDLGGVRRIE